MSEKELLLTIIKQNTMIYSALDFIARKHISNKEEQSHIAELGKLFYKDSREALNK